MLSLKNKQENRHSTRGFTVVELITVIAVIGILAAVATVSYGAWRTSIAQTQVKNDLGGVSGAMNDYRNFKNGYPTSPLFSGSGALFEQSEDVVLTYAYGDASTYCISGQSTVVASVRFHITNSNTSPQAGLCPIPIPGNVAAQAVSSSKINLTWNAVPGATQYTIQRATTSSFTSYATSTATSSNLQATGLASGTTYYFRVSATTPNGTSTYSTVASAQTQEPNWTSTASNSYYLGGCTSGCGGVFGTGFAGPGIKASEAGYQLPNYTGSTPGYYDYQFGYLYGCDDAPCGSVTLTFSTSNANIQIFNPETGTWGATYDKVFSVSVGSGGTTFTYVRIPSTTSTATVKVNVTQKPSTTYMRGDNSMLTFFKSNP